MIRTDPISQAEQGGDLGLDEERVLAVRPQRDAVAWTWAIMACVSIAYW